MFIQVAFYSIQIYLLSEVLQMIAVMDILINLHPNIKFNIVKTLKLQQLIIASIGYLFNLAKSA